MIIDDESMSTSHLPQYLRMYRKRNALAQQELAILLGASHGSKVSRYERGNRLPSLSTVMAYEIVFRVGLRHLFTGEYQAVHQQIRQRARRLARQISAKSRLTLADKRKLDVLSLITNDLPTSAL
ncbi:MAG: hypothetical protein HMLKMBBP_01667 [Planctomycetes bacterium]|nr:hypothetical protein [Planctomycetota bacterium]